MMTPMITEARRVFPAFASFLALSKKALPPNPRKNSTAQGRIQSNQQLTHKNPHRNPTETARKPHRIRTELQRNCAAVVHRGASEVRRNSLIRRRITVAARAIWLRARTRRRLSGIEQLPA